MKQSFLKIGVCLIAITALVSCGSGSSLPKNIDFKMLQNKEEVQKIYDEIINRVGDNLANTDEVRIFISRPSKEGTIKRNDPDNLIIWVDVQDPKNPKQLLRHGFYSDWNGQAGWRTAESMEVRVSGSDVENFRLEDNLFNFKEKVNFETFFKVLTEAYNKADNPEKFTYQYIKSIDINLEGYDITVFGILSANDQEKSNYFKANFDGIFKK